MTKGTGTQASFPRVEELRLDDQKILVKRLPSKRQTDGFVTNVPLRILIAVMEARAEKAIPLILAIHRKLYMSKREEIPLSGAIWDAIGRPSESQKAAMLRKLKKLPQIIRITTKQTLASYYRVTKGPLWKEIDPKLVARRQAAKAG